MVKYQLVVLSQCCGKMLHGSKVGSSDPLPQRVQELLSCHWKPSNCDVHDDLDLGVAVSTEDMERLIL